MTKGNTTASPPQDPTEADADGARTAPPPLPPVARRTPRSTKDSSPLPEEARVTGRSRRSWGRRVLAALVPVLCAALLAGGVWAYASSRPVTYSSEALVSVLPIDPANPVSSAATAIWVQIGNSDNLRTDAASRLGVTEGQLADAVSITQAGDAALVSVEVTTGSAARSADWANGVAEALVERSDRNFVAGYDLQQVTSALPSQATAGFSPLLVGAAAVVGLLIGIAIVQAWGGRRRRHARPGGATA